MATDSTSPISVTSHRSAQSLTATQIVQAILTPLSSLRLTVALLFLSVLVVFIITLQQSSREMWDIKKEHYAGPMVFVPFQSVIVQRWFPDSPPIEGGFWVPSGLSLIVLMLVNLTTAHLLRFRLRASGPKLILGGLVAVVGAVFTWAIIFNTQSATTFQGEPFISYRKMWLILQWALGGLTVAGLLGCFSIGRGRNVERMVMGVLTGLVGGALAVIVLLGEDAFIGREGMRIVWQLAQSTVAALICLIACVLLFRRKGGIVLLHLGLGGLMVNELYVHFTNEETQMSLTEGQTSAVAQDIRSREIVVIDQSDAEVDRFISVPDDQFLQRTDDERYVKIDDDALPFTIEVLEFLKNADLIKRQPGQNGGIKTDGILSGFTAFPRAQSDGVSVDQAVDRSAAYVRLTKKDSLEDLGTFLLAQIAYLTNQVDSISVDGKTYQIALRFKTEYKPYSLTLTDVQAKNYTGTNIPSWYSSDVIVKDHQGIETEQQVFMNNPLRYAGETFYQTGYARARTGEVSTLQIVKNKGWMIPYVCCMFVTVGLVAQFGSSLIGFLEKHQQQEQSQPAESHAEVDSDRSALEAGAKRRVSLALCALLAVATLYPIKELASSLLGKQYHQEHEGLRLDLLGQVPITHGGRIQVLDSLSRNTLRQLTKRETVYDGQNEKQPAIRWLADLIFAADGFADYRLLRIEDTKVVDALGLAQKFDGVESGLRERLEQASDGAEKKLLEEQLAIEVGRPSLRYTLEELADARDKVRELIPAGLDEKEYSPLQSRLAAVSRRLADVQAIQASFGALHRQADQMDFEARINLALSMTRPGVPLLIPQVDALGEGKPWYPLAKKQDLKWVQDLAKSVEADNYQQLAVNVVEEMLIPEMVPNIRRQMFAQVVVRLMNSDRQIREMMSAFQADTDEQLIELVAKGWQDRVPARVRNGIESAFEPRVNNSIESRKQQLIGSLAEQFPRIGGLEASPPYQEKYLELFEKLGPAYRRGDADTFNDTLKEYLASINQDLQPTEDHPALVSVPTKIWLEGIYNKANLFYHAMVIFGCASLFGLVGLIDRSQNFGRSALVLLGVGSVLLVVGLALRIAISGRPPVTNLYSSVLFVSAVFVPLMMICERLTKVGIGNILGGAGGFLALMWAWSMSISDGDTFTVLRAVLDTQFWLATHVVCVTIGYSTTFAAGAVGLAYVIGAGLTSAFDKQRRKTVADVMYGMVCLGLLFSFFGTVLGGLWGDDSWGRFWGWDPKENGALMIVLWNAISLHARWAGIVRERGFAMIAIFGNVVTLWSWKGVNVLNVGLHAYADSADSTLNMIVAVGLFHLLIMLLATVPTKYWPSYNADLKKG